MEFEDIRSVTQNNKLEPDWDVIFNEYLPFQIFIEGRTIFKGLTVHTNCSYAQTEQKGFEGSIIDLLEDSTEAYLDRHNFSKDNAIAAVSGGVDSSVVALLTKPNRTYLGYYDVEGFSEIEYSSIVADKLKVRQHGIKLTESDFLSYMDNVVDNIGVPIGGLGSVMEYAALHKLLKNEDINTVLFGNGGDELFLGYFFCHIVKDFVRKDRNSTIAKYMSNFKALEEYVKFGFVGSMIWSILNRSHQNICDLGILKIPNNNIPDINYISKLLRVTIDYILPSLLHLNQQICKANNVFGLNPLANSDLIQYVNQLNTPMSDIPKQLLRFFHPDMPNKIAFRIDKQGFPIPMHVWPDAYNMIYEVASSFLRRKEVQARFGTNIPELSTVHLRYIWGMFQTELFLVKHGI